MSDFSHMPKGDEGEEERNGELAKAIKALIADHAHKYGDESGKPVCPGCMATALFNTLVAMLQGEDEEHQWNGSDFLYALGVLQIHVQNWVKDAIDSGALTMEEVQETQGSEAHVLH